MSSVKNRFKPAQILFFLLLISLSLKVSAAAELDGVKVSDEVNVDGQKLILNGYATRKVYKFGLPIKVYVGALYLKQKNQSSEQIVQSPDLKQLIMTFVRSVDRDALSEAFQKGYNDACLDKCEEKGQQFSKIKAQIRNVGSYDVVRLTFWKEKMKVEWGTNPPAEIMDAELSKNFLNIFINEKNPPTKEFRQGLLGLPN